MLVVASVLAGPHVGGSRGNCRYRPRQMCAIAPGQPLLLAALIAHDLLVIHPASTVARLLADLHAQVIGALVTADPARVAAARQLLAHLGVTLADLQVDPGPNLPTLAEYLPRVSGGGRTGRPSHLRDLLEPHRRRLGRPSVGRHRGQRHRGHAMTDRRDPVRA